jgi:GH18 family chitinase
MRYLQYFDVPALLEYADWTNIMSYDLHGKPSPLHHLRIY